MSDSSKILVISGSTRARRIGPQIAAWVTDLAREEAKGEFELIDLRDWPLPMDDEPGIPAAGGYDQPHTLAWSRKISEAHGFVFVTPQYNWGYPAPLKNALDHLYREWSEKPALIVSYGGHGGGKSAEQLRQVLEALHMKPLAAMPALMLPRAHIVANSGEIDPASQFAGQAPALREALKELGAALG